jgi:hypothetical protein
MTPGGNEDKMRDRRYGAIAGLLVIVVVLLAANLIVAAPGQEVRAHNFGPPVNAVELNVLGGVGGPEGPSVSVYRLWSDGTVERNQGLSDFPEPGECFSFDWCGWETVPE